VSSNNPPQTSDALCYVRCSAQPQGSAPNGCMDQPSEGAQKGRRAGSFHRLRWPSVTIVEFMFNRVHATLLLAMAAATGCADAGTGPDKVCHLLACPTGNLFMVTLTSESDAGLTLGVYVIDVMTESGSDSLSCSGLSDTFADCSPAKLFYGSWDQGVIGLVFGSVPKRVTIRVRRDGHELMSRSISPRHGIVRPNGPGCEPSCDIVYPEVITL
jgi:hypothetical protein